MTETEIIMSGLIVEQTPPPWYKKGGQQVGIVRMGCKVSHPDIDLTITCHECRTFHQNIELAKTLFELAVSEIFKL